MGGGPSRETGCGRQGPPSGGRSKCEGGTALCRSEEGEPLDGRDKTIVVQVVVLTSAFSVLSLIANGLFIILAIYPSFCTNKLKEQMTV